MICRKVRELVDQSERPEVLPHEVLRHTAECPACGAFADERLKLRQLLVSAGRISAPPNFDTLLAARIAERKTKKSTWLLSPVLFWRLGTASAMALVALVLIQNAGLVGTNPEPSIAKQNQLAAPTPTQSGGASADSVSQPLPAVPEAREMRNSSVRQQRTQLAGLNRGAQRVHSGSRVSEDEGVVIWLRTPEREVGVPIVSVGAQQQYLFSSIRQAAAVRTSF